ncbi:hypothetical protein CPB84DRAFT_1676811 [Gymnopilus junonius]|uniref:CFA20 domain-containing protein n=1 Tax=Gymnopilus junonius TaxID=109634 RepID=A0A9P5TPE2_GYMJU|nr:hypothetical protein CPB84DRAFT_1676811 [Gymnopilus junonius]
MFSSFVQPSTLSLFSSTSSNSLSLFSLSVDQALPSDSFIHLLHDRLSSPLPDIPRTLLHLPIIQDRGDEMDSRHLDIELEQTILHIQSPTIRTTYIQCPAITPIGIGDRSPGLGIKHPWMHLQVRNLGKEWSFEVGIVDHAGRTGIIRLSTFQKKPDLRVNHAKPESHPILLLPLSFPSRSTHPLTPWSTININFPSLLPYFSSPTLRSLSLDNQNDMEEGRNSRATVSHPNASSSVALPSGTYSYVSYIRVYANCRLRRIWFSEGGPSQKVPWEFELYSAD